VRRRLIALVAVVGVLAVGPACAQKDEAKKSLLAVLQESAHASGVFRYSDETPTTPFAKGSLVQVRGLVEDDFRYKARLTVDGTDALDEVVNDDALAVRFLDPSFVTKFTAPGGDSGTRSLLAARYWVTDPEGAPSIGDAAVTDRVIGIDPIVDALSIVDYASDAISASLTVQKFNAERLDYRPAEDPFPRPAPGSNVTRWDLVPPPMPRADAVSTGQGNAGLARTPVFRKMAIYVRDGRVVQIREQLAAKFELLDRFRDYMIRLLEQADAEAAAEFEEQIAEIEDQPALLEAGLNVALNGALTPAGEDPVRFRSMKYEFSYDDSNVKADLPYGPEVKYGSLAFFGVNSKSSATATARRQVGGTASDVTTTSTTSAP
jgi:hypothetical protein